MGPAASGRQSDMVGGRCAQGHFGSYAPTSSSCRLGCLFPSAVSDWISVSFETRPRILCVGVRFSFA